MAQYISKDIAVAEIERRISNLHPKGGQGIVVTKILKDHYKDYLSFLNTLEVKEVQEESVSEDLEKEIKRYLYEVYDRDDTVSDIARHFAKWQKEQMMKDSIDAELDDVCGFLTISVPYHNGIAGDKVKVIIIKSE